MSEKDVPEEYKVHLTGFFPDREKLFEGLTPTTPRIVYSDSQLKKILEDSNKIPTKHRAKLVDIGDDF